MRGLLPVVIASAAVSCRLANQALNTPSRLAGAVVRGSNPPPVDPAELQSSLLRFADEFITAASAAFDSWAANAASPEERRQALREKIGSVSLAIAIAARPNPYIGLLDFTTFTTLYRRNLERRLQAVHQPDLEPSFTTARMLETNIWQLASKVLTADQRQELQLAIDGTYASETSVSRVLLQPLELTSNVLRGPSGVDRPEGLFGLLRLDPMAGLDPAVREVTRSRLLAERALFTLHRMPILLRWQSELLAEGLMNQPQVTQALAQTGEASQALDRLSRAADSLGRTAASLPERLSTERQALVASLESNEARLRELGAEWGQTLSAGQQFSSALTTTLETFDRLMQRFGVGEPAAPSSPEEDQGPPFNILDYAQTAEQLTTAAEALDRLVKDLGGTLDSPGWSARINDLDALARRTQQDLRSLLNHAFLLGSGLVLLAFGCALLFRRWTGGRAPRASP